MGPRFPLLVAALGSCLLPALGCLVCDKRVLDALKSLETDYLPDHLGAEHHKNVMEKLKAGMKDFENLQLEDESFYGVIDDPTLEKGTWSFLKDLKRITDSDVKGELLVKELFWMLKQQKEILARHVSLFQKDVLCPNKCGMMLQTLTWCETCEKKVHACRKNANCGERSVKVHEMEDMILDCELNWHHASEGLKDYSFYRVWKNKTERLVYKGTAPTLTKPMVKPSDAGTYRCQLNTVKSEPATIIHYQVRVLPKRIVEETPSTSIVPNQEDLDMALDEVTWAPNKSSTTIPPPSPSSAAPTPTVENMLRSLLVGLLIWGFVVLIASIVILMLCYWSEKNPGYFIDSIKSWVSTAKEAAQSPKVPEKKAKKSRSQ
ncbi:izumo sperm-egg fusion protein 1 isoform X1 [Eptesicus fuscus]|uniref:izumo sperm-egg fusion protein 1 isoform X1 n=2 Tax=Eptesicus fuscus TaxID=29078 RepID=UPI0024042366|nr:izumo sperm-egg fusion protein 1 isoform X1 [Eptesicus fuscus]